MLEEEGAECRSFSQSRMAESISLHCSAPDCDYETAERKKKKAEEEAKRKEDENKLETFEDAL